jgi:hypothetical protein
LRERVRVRVGLAKTTPHLTSPLKGRGINSRAGPLAPGWRLRPGFGVAVMFAVFMIRLHVRRLLVPPTDGGRILGLIIG